MSQFPQYPQQGYPNSTQYPQQPTQGMQGQYPQQGMQGQQVYGQNPQLQPQLQQGQQFKQVLYQQPPQTTYGTTQPQYNPYGQQQILTQPQLQPSTTSTTQGYSAQQPTYGTQQFPSTTQPTTTQGYSSQPTTQFGQSSQFPQQTGFVQQGLQQQTGQYPQHPSQYSSQSSQPLQFGQQPQQNQPRLLQSQSWGASYYNQINQQDMSQLQSLFGQLDTSKRGVLTAYEISQMVFAGKPLGMETAKKVVKVFDKDYSGAVDFYEFAAVYQFMIKMQQAFESSDKDKSGYLDSNEIYGALQGA